MAPWLPLLLACSGGGDDATDGDVTDTPTPGPETGATGDTGSTPGTALQASCALSAGNALRVECAATLAEPGGVALELSAAGAPTRRFASDGAAVEHALLGWGLKPETTYDWQIGGVSGQITTGPLPAQLAGAEVVVDGDPGALGFDAILQPLACADMWMVMLDPDGDVVWYEPNDVYATRRDGYEWVQADRAVLSIGAGQLVETHVSGEERLRLQRDVHFDGDLHHDITRWGPYTYALFEERVGSLNVDGIYVFEGLIQRGRFFLGDHYPIPGTGMGDWSHANGLNATADGKLVMSLHTFSDVMLVDGDPASPTYLEIGWVASGTPDGLPDPTYVPAAGPREGFEGQHNAQIVDGTLWLFDNAGIDLRSRGARYGLDDAAGEVVLDAEWELGGGCPIQGGAIPVDGGVIVSCSSTAVVSAFEEAGASPIWTLQATCSSPTDTLIRGIPVTIE